MSLLRAPLRFALFAASLAAAAHAGVIVVDPQGAPGLPLLDAALTAAVDGDVILVRAGNYLNAQAPLAVAGKGITIVNDAHAQIDLTSLAITGVPAGSTFALRGLHLWGFTPWVAAVSAKQCAGTIWIEDCTVTGATGGWGIFPPATPGGPALETQQVAGLVIARSTVRGGKGGYNPVPHSVGPGGIACDVVSTAVAIYQSLIVGGDSGDWSAGSPQGQADGGHGLVVSSSPNVFIAGSTLAGGEALEDYWGYLSNPGSGLIVTASSVRMRDSSAIAGSSVGTLTAAPIVDPSGGVSTSTTPARSIEITSPVRSGQNVQLSIHGIPNDVALILLGSPAPPVAHVGFEGSFVFGLSAFIGPVVFGTIPANGLLSVTVPSAPLPAGVDGAKAVVQAAIASSGTIEAATLYVQVGPNF